VAALILFPAIDLKDGRCVRLVQGDMEQATVFGDDPAAQAASFEAQGFEWLHVVDLDGAFAGKPMNANAVDAILRRVTIPVQLGGGIRDMKTVEGWLAKGVARIIIGTAAVRDPDFVRDRLHRHRPRRRPEGPQHSDDPRPRRCRLDPGDRLGRSRLDQRRRAPARARLRQACRRDHRTRPL